MKCKWNEWIFLWETVITILYNPEQKKILLIFVHIYQFQRIKITFKNHQPSFYLKLGCCSLSITFQSLKVQQWITVYILVTKHKRISSLCIYKFEINMQQIIVGTSSLRTSSFYLQMLLKTLITTCNCCIWQFLF